MHLDYTCIACMADFAVSAQLYMYIIVCLYWAVMYVTMQTQQDRSSFCHMEVLYHVSSAVGGVHSPI